METIAAIEQTQCDGPNCDNLINQQPGGHRRRRFCSDDCKQRAYRDRQGERRQREIRERWADFSPETQQYLDWLVKRNDDRREFVEGIEAVIRRERGKPPLSEAEAMAQARLHTYIGNNWYLESTQRVFVELLRVYGHEMASKVRTAINQERGHARQARQAISLLPSVNEPVDERYRQYGLWLLECGKRLKYHPLSLNVYKERCPGLFEGETDIYDIEGDRSHWEVAAYSFSAEGQLIAIAHAHQAELLDRLLEQERKNAAEQAFQYNVRLGDAQRVQQALTTEQGKVGKLEQTLTEERAKFKSLLNDYMQAGKKIANLERDVQRFERMKVLKSRESMLQELMLLGGRLKYTSMTDLGISEGIDHWLNYIRGASDEDLAKAIAHGFHQADSLAMAAIEASDVRIGMQMRKRINELERDVTLRDARIVELESGQGQEVGNALIKQQLEQKSQHIVELEQEVQSNITDIHRLQESHSSTLFTMNNLLAAAQSAEREEGAETRRIVELEREIEHLNKRIEKQYERRIAKQQTRIQELEEKVEKLSVRKINAELEQAWADLRGLRQERAREQTEFQQIYDRAIEQQMDLKIAAGRIKTLEEDLELAQRGSEGVQRRFQEFVRMTHEKQQLISDVEQGKLPTREELIVRLLAVGERLQYRLLPLPQINAGLEGWQHFAKGASSEQLSEAITNAEHYYKNLVYLDELDQRTRQEAQERRAS